MKTTTKSLTKFSSAQLVQMRLDALTAGQSFANSGNIQSAADYRGFAIEIGAELARRR